MKFFLREKLLQIMIRVIQIGLFYMITACGGGNNYSVSGSVSQASSVAPVSLTIFATGNTVNVGSSQQFTAFVTNSDNSIQNVTNSVTWTSSQPTMATVSSVGLVTGVQPGNTTVQASLGNLTSNGISMTTSISPSPLASLAISPLSSVMVVGNSVGFIAQGTYADASKSTLTNSVSWTSSSPTVATISSSGILTALSLGTTAITASLNGITSSIATLTVRSDYTKAYIANLSGNTVSTCSISSPGTLSGCTTVNSGNGFSAPKQITINGNYAYIVNSGGSISMCQIIAGSLGTSCSPTGSGFGAGPIGIAFYGSYAYIATGVANTIYQCSLNTSSGTIGSCFPQTVSGVSSPQFLSINNNYLYVPDGLSKANVATYCLIDSVSGNLTNCKPTGNNANIPQMLVFIGSYVYVTNYGGGTGFMSQCTANPDGSLTNCATTGPTLAPVGATSDGQYMYLTFNTSSALSSCKVNSLSSALGPCTTTGSGFNGTFGVALY